MAAPFQAQAPSLAPFTFVKWTGTPSWPKGALQAAVVEGDPIGQTLMAYRFPLMPFGAYRLAVVAPSPYTAPSTATPAMLTQLARPNGQPFLISDASFGAAFDLVTLDAVRIDIPVDRPNVGVTLTKSASRSRAQPSSPSAA